MRLGVALLIPGRVAVEIDGLRRAFGATALGRVPPHVTLVPPVNINESRRSAVIGLMRSAAATVPPFRLELGPMRSFWPDTPVLHLEVGGDLAILGRLRDGVFRDPLARSLSWPFVPHVTIAEDIDPDRIPVLVEQLHAFRASVTIERIQLLCEEPGRQWSTLAEMDLGGPRIVGRGGLELEISRTARLDPEAAEAFERAWESHRVSSYGSLPPAAPFAVAARREGAVVGVATGVAEDGGELWLERLVVDAAARTQGVGRHVLAEVERIGVDRGCRRALLVCQSPLAAWYAGHGWTTDLALPGWRSGVDFVRMTRAL
ncbi:MAG: hypothetical protein NVSMB16_13260 [Acidimicrobiales bacterium]